MLFNQLTDYKSHRHENNHADSQNHKDASLSAPTICKNNKTPQEMNNSFTRKCDICDKYLSYASPKGIYSYAI